MAEVSDPEVRKAVRGKKSKKKHWILSPNKAVAVQDIVIMLINYLFFKQYCKINNAFADESSERREKLQE